MGKRRALETGIARGPGAEWFRTLIAGVAAGYLLIIGLSNTGLRVSSWLPPVPRYFTQVACLFPTAAQMAIEYRAEGWSCRDQAWIALDHRPDFPLHAENKESRFHRVGHFYRSSRPVLQALDAYVVERHNARVSGTAADTLLIGGMRLMSLRIPFPEPGEPVPRYRWRHLSEYPEDYRKHWYWTPGSIRNERCLAVIQ